MKGLFVLILAIGLSLVGCSQDVSISNHEKNNATKGNVFSTSWDGNPVIVKQKNFDGDYEIVNEINDSEEVKKVIEALGNADWKWNVYVDILPPDYSFTLNSYEHSVWINEEYERLELITQGQANYGTLSKASSEIIFEILTGEKF
ncbi:hypothetical protein [Lederbergia graminis]|uniref:YhfM-like domain-containing protein n=1 Tax=Lederbergia graminis TaxID=735518 RepID=A0ABW0LJA5_9BACI